MKLTAITDEISQNFEHALDVLLEYGIRHAELRGLWGTNIADLSPEQAQRAKNALEERGMSVVCLSTPFYKCDLALNSENEGEKAGPMHLAQPRTFEQQKDILRRCADLAELFGTKYLRVFTFWRKAVLTPEIEAQIVEAFQEPLAFAKERGLTLLLENEYSCYIGTGEEAARIVQTINHPNLKIVWDPGNAFCADEVPYPNGYNAIKPYFVHMHIKDANMVVNEEKGRHPKFCVIGEGELDYVGHLAALREDGYEGFLSLETHYIPPTGRGENGKGTSEDGSRACIESLQKLLATA